MKNIRSMIVAVVVAMSGTAAPAEELCDAVRGAVVIAQDDRSTMLGKITADYDSQSIFNEYGQYGSEYQTKSMWSEYGPFGSEYGEFSAKNTSSSNPPMIIKGGKIIGYVSSNRRIRGALNLVVLKALCKDEM